MSELDPLSEKLSKLSPKLNSTAIWPAEQLELCAEHRVFEWFVAEEFGGFGASPSEIVEGYIQIGSACLTTAFVITQRTAACKRFAATDNRSIKSDLLPKLAKWGNFRNCRDFPFDDQSSPFGKTRIIGQK